MNKYDETAARKWLHNTGMELISDQLCTEGGKLIFYSKFYDKRINEEKFIKIICAQMWGINPKDMDDFLKDELAEIFEEVRKLKLAAFI